MLAPITYSFRIIFNANIFTVSHFSCYYCSELLALLFLLVYIVQLAFYFFLVIMLVQLTKNQVTQYVLNPLDDNATSLELLIAIIGFSAIVFFVYVVFLTA